MAKQKVLIAVMLGLVMMLARTPAMAQNYGMVDREGVWRDAAYWHENYPDWVYRYHPEWVVDRQEWWIADHREHPEWFGDPFWREHPIWTYGAYDQYHQWRYAEWWHEHNPAWFYANHPRWAEPYPRWIREDHAAHPGWFRSDYWHDHPHDWNHPNEAYRNLRETEYRHTEYNRDLENSHREAELTHHNEQYSHRNSEYSHGNDNYHNGAENKYYSNYTNDHRANGSYASSYYHPGAPSYPTEYHAPAVNHAAMPSQSNSGGGGHHH